MLILQQNRTVKNELRERFLMVTITIMTLKIIYAVVKKLAASTVRRRVAGRRAGPGRAALSTRKTAACAIFTFQLFPPFLITGSKLESRIFLLSRGGRLSPTISGL